MTKSKALDNFFNSFGLPAYPQHRVPNDVTFPYLTYEKTLANNGKTTNPRIVLWYRTESEKVINDKADEIQKAIGMCESLRSEDGTIYVYFNDVWQAIEDQADDVISGMFTNLSIRFDTK